MISKRNTLLVSGFLAVIVLIWDYLGNFRLCGSRGWGGCVDVLASVEILFVPILPFFLFSLVTYWMREEIYQAWFRFARWWIPISMLAIFIAPEYSHDWLYPIEKGGVALVSSIIFCAVSILIIGVKYVSLRRSKV